MSVTDDVIDWHLPNKIINCATARYSYSFGYDKKWFDVRNIEYESNYEYIYQKRCNHSAGVALKCAVHHERNAREEKHYVYVARTSNNRVTSSGDQIYCLLPHCEALRTCCSVFSDRNRSFSRL